MQPARLHSEERGGCSRGRLAPAARADSSQFTEGSWCPKEGGESSNTDVVPRVRASTGAPGPEVPDEGTEADKLVLYSRDHSGRASLRTKGRHWPVMALVQNPTPGPNIS